ncbi:MAG: hypothetical protein C4325_13610 [Blastocatellia bacterium]
MSAKARILQPKGLFVAAVAAITVAFLTDTAGQTLQLREIDHLECAADRYSRSNKTRAIAIADIAEYDSPRPEWKRFASEEELDMFSRDNSVYTAALNWVRGRNLVVTSISSGSPSGDWARYVKYVFYDDGRTAKISDELRTFYGNCIARTFIYLSRSGRILEKQTRSFDLVTRKPLKRSCDTVADASFHRNARELPFYALVIRK